MTTCELCGEEYKRIDQMDICTCCSDDAEIDFQRLRARAEKAEAEVTRLRAVLRGLAEADCYYGDNCPDRSRHGRCTACVARDALEVKP